MAFCFSGVLMPHRYVSSSAMTQPSLAPATLCPPPPVPSPILHPSIPPSILLLHIPLFIYPSTPPFPCPRAHPSLPLSAPSVPSPPSAPPSTAPAVPSVLLSPQPGPRSHLPRGPHRPAHGSTLGCFQLEQPPAPVPGELPGVAWALARAELPQHSCSSCLARLGGGRGQAGPAGTACRPSLPCSCLWGGSGDSLMSNRGLSTHHRHHHPPAFWP